MAAAAIMVAAITAAAIMAEAIMNRKGQPYFTAYSAGSQPRPRPVPMVTAKVGILSVDTSISGCG